MAYSSNAFQATHLYQRVYDKLEQTKGLQATGGSETTIVDSALSSELDDSAFNGGYTAFVSYDAGGAGAAPEGEYQRVSAYTASTKTLTTAAFTVAIAAGDRITLARGSLYPFYDVRRLCNNALKELGRVPNIDTSLTTAASQTEYNIPATVQWDEIVKVEIQTYTDDADDNQYTGISFSVVPPTTDGGTAVLVIPQQVSGYTLRITHMGQHVDLVSYDSYVSKVIHPALAVAACALECARWKREVTKDHLLPQLEKQYEIARVRHPVTKFIKKIGGMPHWEDERHYQGDQSFYDRVP